MWRPLMMLFLLVLLLDDDIVIELEGALLTCMTINVSGDNNDVNELLGNEGLIPTKAIDDTNADRCIERVGMRSATLINR
jgi:hypothetical protein